MASKLLSLIYNSTSPLLDIEQEILASTLMEWRKVVLKVALYERHNYPIKIIIKYLGTQKMIFNSNKEVLNIINSLLTRIKTKNKIFDAEYYENILSRDINISDNIVQERVELDALTSTLMNQNITNSK